MKCPYCGNDMMYVDYERLVLTKETGLVYIQHKDGIPYRIEETDNPRFEPREEPYDESYKCPWCGKEIATSIDVLETLVREGQ